VLHTVTSYWRTIVAELLDGEPSAPLRSLRMIDIGGEPTWLADLAAWRRCGLSNVELVNGYGPTEAVVTATGFRIPPGASIPADARSVPIGTPLGHRRVHILDERQQPVPVGAVGELFIGGSCLARGYLNDPQLTRERFVPDPFADASDARMYRTGDLVRETLGGALEFVGRLDDQVKIRGHRIETGEITSALCGLDGVAEAAVVLTETRTGMTAVVVLERDCRRTAVELRTALTNVLPSYMVPSAIHIVPKLPISATSGKLDRQRLRQLVNGAPGADLCHRD
jgi:acyl-coenzyme A synthetase/AMP-(fatty) acid ligase